MNGTPIGPEDLHGVLLLVAGAARERLLVLSPVVDPLAVEALQSALRAGVQLVIASDTSSHVKAVVADGRLAVVTSTSLIAVGTGLGFVPEIDEETGESTESNLEFGIVLEGPEDVGALLGALGLSTAEPRRSQAPWRSAPTAGLGLHS